MSPSLSKLFASALITGLLAGTSALANNSHEEAAASSEHKASAEHGHKKHKHCKNCKKGKMCKRCKKKDRRPNGCGSACGEKKAKEACSASKSKCSAAKEKEHE